jgi:hypothetical protein
MLLCDKIVCTGKAQSEKPMVMGDGGCGTGRALRVASGSGSPATASTGLVENKRLTGQIKTSSLSLLLNKGRHTMKHITTHIK